MPFLRPASPTPLQLPSSSMEGLGSSSSSSGDYMIGSPTNPSPNPNLQSAYNPLSRLLQSPTPPNMKNKLRRPSQLSMTFDRSRAFHNPSSSSSSSVTGVGMTSPVSGLVVGPSHPSANSNSNVNMNTIESILQAAPVIYSGEDELRPNRGRASSTASSMSFGFSPKQRSISLEGNNRGEGMSDDFNENEETPNARRSARLAQSGTATLMRRKRMMGIYDPNESESSHSNNSNGGHTPDLVAPRLDEVDALAMDLSSSVKSSPMKDGIPVTPPNSAITLDEPTPFTITGPLKPARLLRLQKELTAPALDEEARSEAAFARLVQNNSDLATRLRLSIAGSTPSPARKRQPRDWMANWAAAGGSALSSGGANETRNWAGRFPESAAAEDEGETTDSNSDDGEQNATLTLSRPPSSMGIASMPMPIGGAQSIGGRSRSGSTVAGMDSMMLSTSYGAASEGLDSMGLNGGMMDLDMASNMSSPVSTPHMNNWREPFPPSKKRKFSAAVDTDRFDNQPNMKKRKALSPHGHPIAIAANTTTLNSSGPGSFVFPPPKTTTPGPLSMASLSSSGTGNSSSSGSLNGTSMYGGFNNWNNTYGGGMPSLGLGMSLGISTGTPMGMGLAGLTAGMSPGGNHHHRRSGSMSTMAWSRPGSAHSSPLLRPSSGNGNGNGSIPAMSLLLGPSMLSNSTTANEDGNGFTFASNEANAISSGNKLEGVSSGGVRTLGTGSSPGLGSISLPGFTYPNGVPIGQFGGPLTDSPGSRPMMRLPERAIVAMNAAQNSTNANLNSNANITNTSATRNRGGGGH